MEMREEIKALYEDFFLLSTEEERKIHDAKLAAYMKTVPVSKRREAGLILREIMAERKKLKSPKVEMKVKEKLKDIKDVISLSYIAKEFFGKDRTWLYHRINGTLINGKPAAFTEDELKVLSVALKTIGDRFIDTSASII